MGNRIDHMFQNSSYKREPDLLKISWLHETHCYTTVLSHVDLNIMLIHERWLYTLKGSGCQPGL
uniref:Uncharacterized protein n=1 Tax=Picea sitchensis TaxID=3332 RepID=D5A9N8_PICSI|nr:unknown [Picea sitchensis]